MAIVSRPFESFHRTIFRLHFMNPILRFVNWHRAKRTVPPQLWDIIH